MDLIYQRLADERLFMPDHELRQDDEAQQPATTMLPEFLVVGDQGGYPPIHEPTPPAPSGFQSDDGSWYARPDPGEFPEVTP